MDKKQILPNSRLSKQNRLDQGMHPTDVWLPPYETPGVISYTDQDILEELGPAQTNIYAESWP